MKLWSYPAAEWQTPIMQRNTATDINTWGGKFMVVRDKIHVKRRTSVLGQRANRNINESAGHFDVSIFVS